MGDKTKQIIITIGFIFILTMVFILNIVVKDKQISNTERRKLSQLPKINSEDILSGDTSKKFEEYAMDQFIARDELRKLKSFISINVFKQQDNNKLFEKDNAIYKMEYPLNRNNVQKTADKINGIYSKYLKGMNVYYAIIPDKNFYLENDEHLKMNYQELKEITQSTLKDLKYIDIWENLKLEDYYRTDTHWKQENLQEVVTKIEKEMNLKNTSNENYNIEEIGDFYGVYYGQLGVEIEPDKIYIKTSETIDNCITYNYETKKYGKIYDKEKYKTSSDKYDIYLSGATALITIENPNSTTEKELLLLRDSYGSSIAPLLIENYKKITLIDLRYISSNLLNEYINFENQDILFLYSTLILNQNILKIPV